MCKFMCKRKICLLEFSIAFILLTLSGCNWFSKTSVREATSVRETVSVRETIFDKVVSIPKELVLDIPKLPPLCDEIKDLKRGFVDFENGGRIYYEQEGVGICKGEGKKITLVLINGGPGGTHHIFHPYFSQIKDYANIIYYDQRGTGKSSADDTGGIYTIKQAVKDLESLRKALKIEKWAVLGHSYGGLLAQCYALTYPNRCTGIILVTSDLGGGDAVSYTGEGVKYERANKFISQAERNAWQNIEEKARDGKFASMQMDYNKLLSGYWKRIFYHKPTEEELIKNLLYGSVQAPDFRKVMISEITKINLKGKFDNFEIPTLVVEGKWDFLWGDIDRVGIMRKNHPHAQVEIFEKSGHMIFFDEPEKFFSILKNFLEKSSKMQIAYKPGNRLVWPKQEQPSLLRKIMIAQSTPSKSEREKLILACYEQALKENTMDSEIWTRLAYDFIHLKKDYDKCLIVLQKLENAQKATWSDYWQKYGYCVQAWKGHMLDLLGRRDEAIACYNEALKNNNGRSDSYFDNSMCINKQWLEDRLKVPFTWELFKY